MVHLNRSQPVSFGGGKPKEPPRTRRLPAEATALAMMLNVGNPMPADSVTIRSAADVSRSEPEPVLIAQRASIRDRITSSYEQSVQLMNAQGQRLGGGPALAWLGNILGNSGLDERKKVCVEQAEFVANRMINTMGDDVRVGLGFQPDYVHTIVVIQDRNQGTRYYADPWAGTPPTTNYNDIYNSRSGPLENILWLN